MKKAYLLLFFIGLNSTFSIAQEKLTETEKLASLCKIYGFLKYYHPQVAAGKYNWDEQYLKQIPLVSEASDKQSLSLIYNNWIDGLGIVKECKKCKSKEVFFDKNFDLSWTQNDSFFDEVLSKKLKNIEENRLQGKHHYATIRPVGNIEVINETVYENFEFPNEHYRLLALFKYWNVIEYFYPYKYLTDQNWNSVLLEMIPKFKNATNKSEYQLVIKELVAKLDDSHAYINLKNEGYNSLPIKISNINNKAVVSGFYNDSLGKISGLKIGDIITKINGLDVAKETDKNLKYVSSSNPNGKRNNTYYEVLSGKETTVNLTIERNKNTIEIKTSRYPFDVFDYYNQPEKLKTLHENIGYINMQYLKGENVTETFKALNTKKAIIIDLRNYPAFIYRLVTNQISSKRKDFTTIYKPNINYPGKFVYAKNLQVGIKNAKHFKGKVIVLVDDSSISRSEFTAMALQTGENVITIGSQTAGADGDVTSFDFLGGYRTSISGNGILYPDGSETQRKGIKIDVEIHPTIEGLQAGRDEILEKAIELALE